MTVIPYSIELDTVTAHIHTHPVLRFSSRIAVLFLLHGHPSSARHMKPIVNGIFDLMTKKAEITGAGSRPNLAIVTLELETGSGGAKGELESERLYRQQESMAENVSALIDRLPSILSPNYDKSVDTWMVAGVSLGAHAAWMAMDRGLGRRFTTVGLYTRNRSALTPYVARLNSLESLKGSPDFLDIATYRSNAAPVVPLVSSLISSSTRNHIIRHDPVSRRRTPSQEILFTNKHVLALAGAQDGIVSLLATRTFLDRIDVGPDGTKRLVIQQGVGHQCTREMIKEMADLVWKVALT
ncbi:hypothetical protein RhiJN_02746 [Ceratobasidium sp. AG-Ba]|nr:hypothetical protein RhiJN_02746 [Ceratobasidium sp. AG-Ba]QRW03639.1 hypothetical protein RhiLY_02638 [Ceratobasidium sp. AG-Ba]